MLGKGFESLGRRLPGVKAEAMRLGKIAFEGAEKGSKRDVGQAAMRLYERQMGKKTAIKTAGIAAGLFAAGSYGRSKGSYRGPMQTGRGVGRFS